MSSYSGSNHLLKVNETTKLSYDVGRLDISIIEAKDLLDKDVITVSDPYCIIKVGSQEVRTERIKDNLNPVWNENFQMYFIRPLGESYKMELIVYDKDEIVDDFLGKTEFELSKLDGENLYDAWLELSTKGKIHIKMRLLSLGSHQVKFMQLSQAALLQQSAVATVSQAKDVEIQKLAHELNVVKNLKLDDTNNLNQQLLLYKNTLEAEQIKTAKLSQQCIAIKSEFDAKVKENEELKRQLQTKPQKQCCIVQ